MRQVLDELRFAVRIFQCLFREFDRQTVFMNDGERIDARFSARAKHFSQHRFAGPHTVTVANVAPPLIAATITGAAMRPPTALPPFASRLSPRPGLPPERSRP